MNIGSIMQEILTRIGDKVFCADITEPIYIFQQENWTQTINNFIWTPFILGKLHGEVFKDETGLSTMELFNY